MEPAIPEAPLSTAGKLFSFERQESPGLGNGFREDILLRDGGFFFFYIIHKIPSKFSLSLHLSLQLTKTCFKSRFFYWRSNLKFVCSSVQYLFYAKKFIFKEYFTCRCIIDESFLSIMASKNIYIFIYRITCPG